MVVTNMATGNEILRPNLMLLSPVQVLFVDDI